MYIKEILMLLSWPVSIYASLLVIGWLGHKKIR